MANLKEWVLECANGESVIAVVFGEMGWGSYDSDRVPGYADRPRGTVLSWEVAMPFLDYDFDDGFGAPGCEAITAWTENRVIFISQYDGATSPNWVPRNPIAHIPEMPGG